MPFVFGSPDWVAPEADRTAGAHRLAALGLEHVPARRGGPLRARRRILGRKPGTAVPADPPLGDLERGEHRQLRRTNPDPARYATLIRISGRVLHRADPQSQGDGRRPLRPAAADPPNVASGDYLARSTRPATSSPTSTGSPCTPTSADAKAMGAQLTNLRRIMRNHGDRATPLYVTELGWGSDERPDPLAARPLGPGEPALAVLRNALRATACAGRSAASGGSPGPTKAAAASSAAPPAC